MADTPQSPMDLNGILQIIAQNAQQAQGNAQTFGDMLRARRQFVQQAENGVADQAQNAWQGGSNGVPISPAAMDTPALNYHTDNANQTAALTQQMFGYQSQANDLIKSLADIANAAANRGLQQQGLDLQRQELGLKYGVDASGGVNSPGSVLDLHAKNILNGTETLNDVPQEMRPRVAGKLTNMGYDPAKTVKGLVDQAESEYLGKNQGDTGNPLAFGNNPARAAASKVGDILNKITGGAVSTGYEKQQNNYENIRKNFQSELARLSGNSSKLTPKIVDQLSNALPNESDPPDVAAKKFSFVRQQINNIFYNGTQPDTTGGGSTGNTMKVGKYQVSY